MRQVKRRGINKKNIAQGHLSEPEIAYKKPIIRFFSSFEEMNEADAIEMAGFTPVQNFEQVTQMISSFYHDEIQLPMDKKIHFRK